MYVNGKQRIYRSGLTLHALLAELDVAPEKVVVMRGDDVYRRGNVPDVPLADGDVIEIVTMMQGG